MSLRYEQVVSLQSVFEERWDEFVAGSPDEWRTDAVFASSKPLIVSIRYGQNQSITSGSEEEISAAWDRLCNFSELQRVSFAIATHVG